MKKLIIWLALLLPFIANAQVNGTIQKTSSSGTIRGSFGSLGIDTIPRVTGVFVNGYILKYNAATNKWYASPDPTLVGLQDSLTKKANRTFDNVASGAIAKAKVDTSANGLLPKSNLFPLGDTRYAKGIGNAVLTSGNQTGIAGDKTFTDNLYMSGSSSKQFVITSSSGAAEIYLDRAAVSKGEIRLNTSGVSKWSFGFEESSNDFLIRNRSTSSDAFKISNSTNSISAVGSISSTPQGTLYGTASGSITSAQLATSLTDETGTGSAVFGTSPTLTTSASINTGTSNINFGSTSNYGYTSFNGSSSLSGMVGVFGGATGDLTTLYLQSPSGGSFAFRVASLEAMLVNSSGDLTIAGNNATKASGTAWINPSDLRLKKNIGEYSKGLKEVLQIKPKTWYFNEASGFDKTKKHLSPIAQELQKIMPEMVSTYKGKLNDKETDLLQVDASDMTWLLVKAIQEQQAIIEKLNQRITLLEQK